jgi:hypothetical protein
MYPISEKNGEFGTPWTESKLPEEIFEYFNAEPLQRLTLPFFLVLDLNKTGTIELKICPE